MRFVALLALALVGQAPMQCASEPEDALRREETPGEALYGLAREFKAKGDEGAWRATLEHLVARYPNSRHAAMAKDDLRGGPEAPPPPVEAPPPAPQAASQAPATAPAPSGSSAP